jgi:hypothetical protein
MNYFPGILDWALRPVERAVADQFRPPPLAVALGTGRHIGGHVGETLGGEAARVHVALDFFDARVGLNVVSVVLCSCSGTKRPSRAR